MASAVYLTRDIRAIEAAAGDAAPSLMERAGAAAAELAIRLCGDTTRDVAIVAGPGNNGGDAEVVFRLLKGKFFRVSLVKDKNDVPRQNPHLVIDGLFGIGLARPLEGRYAELVDWINAQRCPVLALDIPSGLDADTGRVLGRAVRATHTITFIGLKPGLLTLAGPDHCGEISVADLSLPGSPSKGSLADPSLFADLLGPRPKNFHKGMAGALGIIGGAEGMAGAALLAGRAGLKLGAGRVYVGMLEQQAVDPGAPELMLRSADDVLGLDLDALVVGPGLGQSEKAETLLGAALTSDLPCVLDADALNLIAGNEDLRRACARRAAETLITPHPAEAGRLLAETTAHVQEDRLKAAHALSSNLNAHVVLKGAGSILVARGGRWFVNTSGNPGMASAGIGDVLAGLLGALLAQKLPGEAALVLGTHLHGCAADECVRAGAGPVGLAASELIDPARAIWNRWLART
jgi:hydroxyethylthiazole kinase-like uncharacterized protein yjeF